MCRNIIHAGSEAECKRYCAGVINDLDAGIITKEEAHNMMGEYTYRLMDIFWTEALKKIKENPNLLYGQKEKMDKE